MSKKDKYVLKTIEWAQKSGYDAIKANLEGYETPSQFQRAQDEVTFTPDITAVKGTFIYKLINEDSLIKESFEINLTKTGVNITNPSSNIQVIVTNLNEEAAVIKIVWDSDFIDSAKITNAQFFNIY